MFMRALGVTAPVLFKHVYESTLQLTLRVENFDKQVHHRKTVNDPSLDPRGQDLLRNSFIHSVALSAGRLVAPRYAPTSCIAHQRQLAARLAPQIHQAVDTMGAYLT
jgi:hypothetical protein